MRRLTLLTTLLLLPLATGCASRFAGEWVQDATISPEGEVREVAGERRLALRFEPPATVRSGLLVERVGVVEADTVASDQYWTLQNRTVAQFGVYTARIEDDYLVADVGSAGAIRFVRAEGPSLFPPRVRFPAMVRAPEPAAAPAEPVAVARVSP